MLCLQIVGWFIVSCILMSFIEHQVHRRLMHEETTSVRILQLSSEYLRPTPLCIISITPRYSVMSLWRLVKTRRYA